MMGHPRSIYVLLMLGILVGLLTPAARADDKASPTGTWKWSITTPNGQTIERSAKFKLEGDKLTGSMPDLEGKETPIEDAKYKDGDISFQVTREREGQKFIIKYRGKHSGDTIKGKIELDIGGEARSFDWEAKRVKDSK